MIASVINIFKIDIVIIQQRHIFKMILRHKMKKLKIKKFEISLRNVFEYID